jgi:hypothetical protein
VPELWVPGAPAPSLEDFVDRLNKTVERFAQEHAEGRAAVEVELADGALLQLVSIHSEPGYGFLTLRPHAEEGEPPEDVIVPVGAIREFRVRVAEDRPHFHFGFAAPDDASGGTGARARTAPARARATRGRRADPGR